MSIPLADQKLVQKAHNKLRSCSKCQGRDVTCTCYRAFFTETRKIFARIPVKYRNFSFDDMSEPALQKSVARLRKYAENIQKNFESGTGLLLYGNPGTGKTALGCIVLCHALAAGKKAYFTSVESYKQHSIEAPDIAEEIRTTDFLLIDDIGREYRGKSQFVEKSLDELIRVRTDNLRPTIITTNLEPTAVNESFRFESILKEHFFLIKFAHKDYRDKLQEKLKKVGEEG